jgi:phenylalanyl-tRNA synthetase beta chain
VRKALDLDDTVLEVNATPNRGDCMSVFGIARDYAAAHERRYLKATVLPVSAAPIARSFRSRSNRRPVPDLRLARDSRRARGRKIAGMAARAAAPRRLNSISPVVDVTNYVMMDLGQPLHAYDLESARAGHHGAPPSPGSASRCSTTRSTCSIPIFWSSRTRAAPSASPGSWAARPPRSATTTDVLLEAAHFTPDAVAGRARKLGCSPTPRSASSAASIPFAARLERATALLQEIAGGEAGPCR